VSYLIDASNLGGVLGGVHGSRDSEAVVKFLLPWARSRGKVVVVFDGVEKIRVAKAYGALEVRWGGPVSADLVIRREVEKSPKAWTVVTDDVALGRICQDLGAKVLPASTLAARAGAPNAAGSAVGGGTAAGRAKGRRPPHSASFSPGSGAEKPAPRASDIAHWREVFGSGEALPTGGGKGDGGGREGGDSE
jgi:hypothetical protein